MNWNMVGAIGEILGGLGVIITLAYLARQIRANTIAMRQEAEREAFDGNRLVLSQIARDRNVARIFRIGLAETDRRARLDVSSTPGYRSWFAVGKHWLPDDFRNVIERDMASGAGFVPYSSPVRRRQ